MAAAAWRAWLPTAIGTLATLAILAALGQPIQLFNVLALALLLGTGVDYGIFLLEHEDDGSAWLAVVLGAASTWLSFGLLALSSTPALRSFGLTLLLGIPPSSWLGSTMPIGYRAGLVDLSQAGRSRLLQFPSPSIPNEYSRTTPTILILRRRPRRCRGHRPSCASRDGACSCWSASSSRAFPSARACCPRPWSTSRPPGMLRDGGRGRLPVQERCRLRLGRPTHRVRFPRQVLARLGHDLPGAARRPSTRCSPTRAARQGAEVRYPPHGDGGGRRRRAPVRHRCAAPKARPTRSRPRFLLDASGFGRALPRLLKLETPSNFPVRGAIFTHVGRPRPAERHVRPLLQIRVTVHPRPPRRLVLDDPVLQRLLLAGRSRGAGSSRALHGRARTSACAPS